MNYTILTILFLILLGAFVYALTPGVAPNPGHTIGQVSPPSGCISGQVLVWQGSSWVCSSISPSISGYQVVKRTSSVSGSAGQYKFGPTASCPSGKVVLGGGCVGAHWDVTDFGPGGPGVWGTNEGWRCYGKKTSGTTGQVEAWAICANPN